MAAVARRQPAKKIAPAEFPMPTTPKISVIIPVFNDQAGLDACIAALNEQTLAASEFEIIVVDNGSSPAMALNKHTVNIQLVVCEQPGAYAARNMGIAQAQGQILAFTDADCQPDKNWLKNGIQLLEKNNSAIIGGHINVSTSTKPNALELYQRIAAFDQKNNIEHHGFTVTANLFASAATFTRIGLFNQDLLSGGDLEWCWRAREADYLIHYQPSALVHTAARASVRDAIRQARRIEGGRAALRKKKLDYAPEKSVRPHRGPLASIAWILRHPDLNSREKCRVIAIAFTLKASRFLEKLRLMFGLNPERQ